MLIVQIQSDAMLVKPESVERHIEKDEQVRV